MNPDDLKKILDALSYADVREFSLKTGSFDMELRRGPLASGGSSLPMSGAASHAAPASAPMAAPAPASAPVPAAPAEASAASEVAPVPAAASPAEATAPAAAPASAGTPVKAPIVGTFYAASSPDAAPYVKVGDRVEEGQVLCIIEAMKLMNEIEAESSGVVREILVSNGEPVEFGQTLFIIE
ncbi:acetyl-CoA carboxylase, biotin carboxyl carrier protein [Deinococcus proteolyticus MRP]|uniref:Biotin carboxyl carrier protein of acetyl-CoA carboxylase n=1 Tax=Deinococcus proteolyticus (strain ATCC 35074 / DSM 20540 / JCM 6276 / NBRC 101906 / NCIMB 13154 / VKM Ac-1939 / CCM 2703 / MRP) TaxID=693977 RepID=F0RJ65_DEIPM|nr:MULTISPECIES: acetyl-CoA carboxylase biotin carboxyl carrier protein [Deinococcus]ADY26502.1 acetyl-CoA carboxylase, biotin carboxyl carrier protein [Deinococcus proteolyticus MRP]MCY1702621.1 acetyl-CoA carboxylase biotin carboxyl carrier protein [Deinococcus sp. SL84]